MRRVNVIGGTGFLGSRTVRALGRVAGVEVQALSRRGPEGARLDLTLPETFAALGGAELVVDLGDATRVPPDEAIAWCLERGVTVLEATSDAPCVERLHRRFGGGAAGPGRLILGAGIFTGVSNLLARQAARDLGGAAERVTLAISSSPFSGAGAGTIALMLAVMRQPVVRFVGGARVEEAGMSAGPAIDFGAATRSTLRAPFAEAFMLRESTGAAHVEVLFSPRPGFLVPSFRALPRWFGASAVGQALLGGYFTLLRRGLMRGVAAEVELYALAEGQGTRAERRVVAPDGMEAGAYAIAAMAEAALASAAWSGVRFVDDVCALEAVVARANELAGREVMRRA